MAYTQVNAVSSVTIKLLPLFHRFFERLQQKTVHLFEVHNTGHLTKCGGADPHNSLISASSVHFPHKTEKLPSISDNAAAYLRHKHKSRRD